MIKSTTFSGLKIPILKIVFCFVLVTGCNNNPNREKAQLLDSLFTTMHERGQFNGNVLIAQNGQIIYQNCLGYADREKQIPLNENTLFNTGSVSKIFTAIAIQQLEEKGLLEIGDPVKKHLPGFPYPDVTIHHLLIHAAGLPEDSQLLKIAVGTVQKSPRTKTFWKHYIPKNLLFVLHPAKAVPTTTWDTMSWHKSWNRHRA